MDLQPCQQKNNLVPSSHAECILFKAGTTAAGLLTKPEGEASPIHLEQFAKNGQSE